jgi:hypothetical protein
MIVCLEEDAMTKKRVGPPSNLPEASSAMGPIARGLIEENLGPDHRVIDIERFFTGLMQALHDAYAQGWRDRGHIKIARPN